ncbi:MAG TPA: hypothetical protein PLJ21_04110 [Pseudobdellovibrionaceae bacterium]|nr:hypothetical protein [Pseudobdellovibrionaceae bacterium]
MDNPFVLLTLLVFIFISVFFWSAGASIKKNKITQLNLKATDSAPVLIAENRTPLVDMNLKPVKELSVYFNYNDHSWEAHEVLGVPIGAPLVLITEAYQKAIRETSGSSHDFLEVAYMSLLKKKKSSSSL